MGLSWDRARRGDDLVRSDSLVEREGFKPTVPLRTEKVSSLEQEYCASRKRQARRFVKLAGPRVRISSPPAESQQQTAAITTQTKAANVTTALAACEYSHWIRNSFQFLGTTVQLLVA